MKHFVKNSVIVILIIGTIIYLPSCMKMKDATIPVVTTTYASDITQTTASTGGKVIDNGGAAVTDIGVCWSTSPNPTTSNNTNNGTGTGIFTSIITGLTTNTKYYVRAYATNSIGTAYGNEISFTTNQIANGNLTTTAITDITTVSAVSGGNIPSNGAAVTDYGVCWSTSPNPTTSNSTNNGTGTGIFTSIITGLTANTKYYVRAYATNNLGTVYGNEISFTTNKIVIGDLTTTAITDITTQSAVSGGSVTSNGGSRITEWGVCWNTSGNPTTDNYKGIAAGVAAGSGIFIGVLPDLNQGTTYYVRAYAVNSEGTAYGNEISFSTLSIVTTSSIVSFSSTSAVVTGNVIYGQIGNHLIGSGVCWSTSHNATTDDSKAPNTTYSGIFTTNLTGLTQGTSYFVKAYAEYDNAPTLYGNELSFTTSFEQGTGTQKADFPGGARYDATSFSIGTKVYLGLGTRDGDNILKDFWEWDQASNVWTRKADYPGNEVFGAVGFSIGTKGYIGTGGTNEFWEYDPATNSWTQKSSLPGTGKRSYAVGFSIGTKGYIGTGYMGIPSNSDYRDFWEWDQTTNVWTQKADFGGIAREGAVGFSIGNKGYIGTGSGNGTAYKDFWEWDQATDVWTQKADFAGTSRFAAVGFSIMNKGYIGTGINYGSPSNIYKDFWEWDQVANVWTEKSNLEGDARTSAVCASIGNKAYIGTGVGGNSLGLKDFWEYVPSLN